MTLRFGAGLRLTLCALVWMLPSWPVWGTDFDPGKAGFTVRVGGEMCAYRVLAFFVLPRERLELSVDKPGTATFRAVADEPASLTAKAPGRWLWQAPAAVGLYPVRIERHDGAHMTLNLFVMAPLSEARDGRLRGYRLGHYPGRPLRDLPIYLPPRGFVVVTPDNENTQVSPHFTLKQFLCKQAGDYPKLVALRARLLLKLEHLLQVVNGKGLRCDTFAVLSGFRTPAYNAAIGNVRYSRHQWGGAADIFIDENPRDGVMDDLDGNGVVDGRDADWLFDLIEGQVGRQEYEPFIGGLGKYGTTTTHGPFVHVDARGFRARWGR